MRKLIKLSMILIILISIGLWSCNTDPIEPLAPNMSLNSPNQDNTQIVNNIRIGVYNLVERYYDIEFILEGTDDTRERNVVYCDTFLYNIDMLNKKTGGETSFMITINDIKNYEIVHVKMINPTIKEFIPN